MRRFAYSIFFIKICLLFAVEAEAASAANGFCSTLIAANGGAWSIMSKSPFLALLTAQDETFVNPYSDSTKNSNILRNPNFRRNPDDGFNFGSRNEDKPEGYYYTVDVDSAAESAVAREEVDGQLITDPLYMDLDRYLQYRNKQISRRLWDSLLTSYDIKKALSGRDLARMLSASTGLTIPIPPNPLSSIFGKPEININVNGEVNMRIGWRIDMQNLGTVSAFGQTQSTPMFNQDIRVNVSARIGDKLKFSTDWNTRRTFDYDNKFKIGYEGKDDDVVRLVEIGNVSLPLKSTLIGGGQALFGVRADFQFGAVFLKTLFSQRRGQRRYVNVRGGATKQPFYIRAYDYAKNHFFLDTAYKKVYREYFSSSTPVIPQSSNKLRVGRFEVWESNQDVRENRVSSVAICLADLPERGYGEFYDETVTNKQIESGVCERGSFIRLDSSRYIIDRNLGTIAIQNLRPDRTYAIAYSIEGEDIGSTAQDRYYGYFSDEVGDDNDTLVLKLLYARNMQPGYRTLWSRQMKNVYPINATNVNTQDTKINIWYINQNNDSTDILEGANHKLVSILGVDQVNNSTGQPPPDGQFDLKPPFFNPRTGEITFPSPEPFDEGLKAYFYNEFEDSTLAYPYIYSEVYDTTYEVARRNTARDRFIITGEVSGHSRNRISLGAFNLAPGSVKVTLDGVQLREFEDYVVDYYAGILTLRNPRASLPNANLQIEYEQQDIFNISTRTLAGIRVDYNLFKTRTAFANIGGTLMHYDQSAMIDRVRLGEEPVSNTMLGFDTEFNWETPWLTKAVDFLPFYDTKAKSSFSINGEWAMILPDPNKRRSEVLSDKGEPVVYIDDFEGAQRYISLGLNPAQWTHSSQPRDPFIGDHDTTVAKYRGKMFWYQYFIPRVPIKDVYPNRSIYQGRSRLSPLELVFDPYRRGIYNRNPKFLDDANGDTLYTFGNANKPKIWGGMQRLLSAFNTNFDTENIEYIEIMMYVDLGSDWGNSKMYLDLGQISEDVIPNQVLNTEDGITRDNPYPNNIIDVGEDIGIDGLTNFEERDTLTPNGYPFPLSLEEDPARDDYKFNFTKNDERRTPEDFYNYNNYEGNASQSELGKFPDTEILNSNNGQTIFLDNSYFTYEINLDPNPQTNPQIVGGPGPWYLYRIPVRKPAETVGNPQFSNIQYVRVRFKGGYVYAAIADWRLVGSQWQRISNFEDVSPEDSVLQIAFVNREENANEPDFYTMPPGVQAPRQLNNPDYTQDIRLNEQSISISVKNLRYGEERMATRIFRQLDVFYYKTLKFFVHGDGSMPDEIRPGSIPKAYAYVRFGTDSSNYYEYRRPLLRGWQNIEIPLSDLTAIKQSRGEINPYLNKIDTVMIPGDPLAYYAIKGNPVLTRVRFFGFGIHNPKERFPNELTTTMWVDELRLISPERDPDWAGLVNTNLKIADLGNIDASISHRKPNFHRIEERFGDRTSTTDWSVSMQGNAEKFAPKSFSKMKIPITYTHAEFVKDPKYVANSDVKINKAAEAARLRAATPEEADSAATAIRQRSQTLVVRDAWALTGVKLGIPIDYWLVEETFNKLTLGYSYSQEYERSPIVEQRFNWLWVLDAQWATNIPDIFVVNPFSWAEEAPILDTYSGLKLNFLPSTVSAGLNMTRGRTTEKSRFLSYPSPIYRDFTAQRNAQFQWNLAEGGFLNPKIDYTVSTNSTLVDYELDESNRQRTGSELARLILFNDGSLIDFGRNNRHAQNLTINFQPVLPNIASITSFMDITGSYDVAYSWSNPLQPDPEIHNVAKNAAYNSNLRFNIGLRLKSLANKWWDIQEKRTLPVRGTAAQANQATKPDSSASKSGGDFISSVGMMFKLIFLDFDKIDITLNQTNSANNPGVFGGTGMDNFWARGFLGRPSQEMFGPSFAYQLGLVSNPHGSFHLAPSSAFPFFGFETEPGRRPFNAIMQDNFTQKTGLQISTNRPLWEGAVLDLKWESDVGFNRNQTVITQEDGIPQFTNLLITQSYKRTYLCLPEVFGIGFIGNSIEDVIDLYEERRGEILASDLDTIQKNRALAAALSESFHDGMQSLNWFTGTLGKFMPALNWGIRWEGIEKWEMWDGLLNRFTVEHMYQSHYNEQAQITADGRSVQSQGVQYGFQPLIGVTTSFDEDKVGGALTATLRYNTTTQYSANSANRKTISRQSTQELSLQSSYTLPEFEWMLLGLSLDNNLEFSFLASYKKNQRATFDVLDEESLNEGDGRTLDGTTTITIEPRVRYAMSKRVTASFFVRYDGTVTEGASSPGFSTLQIGFDLRISLAGGR